MMPGELGFETIMKFRRLWRDLPIVAISGRGELLPTALNFGATQTFPKPIQPVKLLKAVRGLVASEPSMRLLLLEDDDSFAGALTKILEHDQTYQYEIDRCKLLSESLAKIHETDFDVIVTDLGLPDSNGLETFTGIIQVTERIPIIVLTGGTDDKLGLQAIGLGAQDYINKTQLNVTMLPRLVRHCIERKKIELSLKKEHQRVQMLLQNLLPSSMALKFGQGEVIEPREFDNVSVLFADLVGFTEMAAGMAPRQIVDILNQVFSAFDQLAQEYGLEKIKTIGDAYMVAAGIPEPVENGHLAVTELGLDMLEEIRKFNHTTGLHLNLRIGIATGPVVAGIIGIDKISYDLWGDTVNLASRMESHGESGRIQVCARTGQLVGDHFILDERGAIPIKGKGSCHTYFIAGRRFGIS